MDPTSKTKVDIFRDEPKPFEIVRFLLGNREINLVSAEDQLVKTIVDLQRISPENKVDPKQFSDAKLLLQITDREKANSYWKTHDFDKYPATLDEAYGKASRIAREHPEWLQKKPFRKPEPYKCKYCQETEDFKIEPMTKIYEILGYVE